MGGDRAFYVDITHGKCEEKCEKPVKYCRWRIIFLWWHINEDKRGLYG